MKRKIELILFLTQVVQRNTYHYRSDLRYDLERLKEAAKETNMEDRVFYWMSRPHGTWCVLERDAFIRESSGHHIWTYGDDKPPPVPVKAGRSLARSPASRPVCGLAGP